MKKLSEIDLGNFGGYENAVRKLLVEDLKCVVDDRDKRIKLTDILEDLRSQTKNFSKYINIVNNRIELKLPNANHEWSFDMFDVCKYFDKHYCDKYNCYFRHENVDTIVIIIYDNNININE